VKVGTGWSGWSGAQPDGQCLPLLVFPCTIKSRSSLLAPAHPGGPGKRAIKWWLFLLFAEMSANVSVLRDLLLFSDLCSHLFNTDHIACFIKGMCTG